MPVPVKKPKVPASSSTRQPESHNLTDAQLSAIDAIVERSMAAAMEKAYGGNDRGEGRRAPAGHTGRFNDRTDYIDDELQEHVGEERMDIRRENSARGREDRERRSMGGYNGYAGRPESSSSVYGRRGNEGVRDRFEDRYSRDRHGRRELGLDAAEYFMWFARAGGDPERAHRMARQRGASDVVTRALGESNFETGGSLVPQNIAQDYIGLLYNASAYLSAGPQKLTVQNGNLTIPKMTSGAQVYWMGESQNITPSQEKSGAVRIDLRTVAALVPTSNMFLKDAGIDALRMIKEDIGAAAAQEIDSVALRSLGTQWRPRGARGWVPTSNTFASAGTTIPQVTTDLVKMTTKLEEARIPMGRLAMFMSPRTKGGLLSARDGNNNPVWMDEMLRGTLYGVPFFYTQNIPNDVGTGGNKSEVYLIDMSQQVFADDPEGMRVDIADGAAYFDGSGVVSGFSRDETVVRVIERMDIVSRRDGKDIVEMYDVAIA